MRRSRQNAGFTLIEILITLVIMAILLGLGVVAMGNIQAQARDSERKQDVETIARGLEARYKHGSTYASQPNGTIVTNLPGTYPGDSEMWQLAYYHTMPYSELLPGVSDDVRQTPTGGTFTVACLLYAYVASCMPPNSVDGPIQTMFSDGSGGYKDIYVYQALQANGRYCNANCNHFKLYWRSETDNTPYLGVPGLKVLKSKHQ